MRIINDYCWQLFYTYNRGIDLYIYLYRFKSFQGPIISPSIWESTDTATKMSNKLNSSTLTVKSPAWCNCGCQINGLHVSMLEKVCHNLKPRCVDLLIIGFIFSHLLSFSCQTAQFYIEILIQIYTDKMCAHLLYMSSCLNWVNFKQFKDILSNQLSSSHIWISDSNLTSERWLVVHSCHS